MTGQEIPFFFSRKPIFSIMDLVCGGDLVNEKFKLISADARKKMCYALLGHTYVRNIIAVLLDCEITTHSYRIIKNVLWKGSLCNF